MSWQTIIHTLATVQNTNASKTGHTHDDRYYTETEINAKLATKNAKIGVYGFDVGSFTIAAKSSKKISWTCPAATFSGKTRCIDYVAVNGTTMCSVNSCGDEPDGSLKGFAWINNHNDAAASGTVYVLYIYW